MRSLTPDGRRIFVTRGIRMFGYGFLSVGLVLYLSAIGLDDPAIGLVLALTLFGDVAVSLWLTTHADRIGRRRTLLAGALLMVLAGAVFAATSFLPLLALAATIGVISPSGNEVGPFLAVEQAGLSQTASDRRRTGIFAWFSLVGSVATALGALIGGALASAALAAGAAPPDAYRVLVIGYAALGLLLAAVFATLSPAVEVPVAPDSSVARRLGLHRSAGVVARLASLFTLDAFAGGFVMQSLIAYWFHVKFGIEPGTIGAVLFAANLFAAASALAAGRLADRFGLLETMVYTHLPSNVLLILVPLMPTLPLAVAVLLARFAISQMDVPTRQAYTMALVEPDERSAAAGVTGIARSLGAAVSPLVAAPLLGSATLASVPFFIAGGCKIVYDVLVYRTFRRVPLPAPSADGAPSVDDGASVDGAPARRSEPPAARP